MTMTFKESCKDVCNTVVNHLTDTGTYKFVMKVLAIIVLCFSSFVSGLFAVIGTICVIFNGIDNPREGIGWWILTSLLVSGSTGFLLAVLIKMWDER